MTPPCDGLGAMGIYDLGGVVLPPAVREGVAPVGRGGAVLLEVGRLVNSALRALEPGEQSRSCSEERGDSPAEESTHIYMYLC